MPKGRDKFSNSIKDNLFINSECPEFDTLVAYHNGKVSSEVAKKIEYHILDCDLCATAIEGFSNVSDIEKLHKSVKNVNSKSQTILHKWLSWFD